METTVRALFDFEGNPGSDELSFFAGEIIVVTNKEAGQGWWEGKKSDGAVGLFPESYVEQEELASVQDDVNVHEDHTASNPPLITTDTSHSTEEAGYAIINEDDFDEDIFGLGIHQSQPDETSTQEWEETNYNEAADENWSDGWNSSNQTLTPQAPAPAASSPTNFQSVSPLKRNRNTTVKTGKNLFSTFTKTAGESFILGETKFDLEGVQQCRIVAGAEGPMWERNQGIFSCTVSDPVKESKFSGLKSFIAYNITPTHTKKSVLRRYKHFDWLYEQLDRKFGVAIAVSYLPDKQLTGRYDGDFIEERRSQLEAWISRMGLHPVISQSEVLQHFVTSKDDEKAWKAGKRKAEKDVAVGGSFLNTIETPDMRMDLNQAEEILETHIKFTKSMEEGCKQLVSTGHDQVKKYTSVYRKDYEKLSQTFSSLSESFALDEREVATPLTNAMSHTGKCFQSISELYGEQPQYDWNPFLTGINEYKSVLSTFPSILENQKTALEKNKEVKRLQTESKVSVEEMEDATDRTEKICYAVQAEINHLQHYRVGDFAVYMKNFLAQQISLHKEIMKHLEEAASDYSDMV